MNALNIPRILVWSSITILNGVRGKINCSLNIAIVPILMIMKNVIVTMVVTTTTVLVVLRDDLNWAAAKNTPD
jgi:hypothetical protein